MVLVLTVLLSINLVSAYDINKDDSCLKDSYELKLTDDLNSLDSNEHSDASNISSLSSNEQSTIKISDLKSITNIKDEVNSVKNEPSEIIVNSSKFEDLLDAVNNAKDNTKIIISGYYLFTEHLKINQNNISLVGSEGTIFDINGDYHLIIGSQNSGKEIISEGTNISKITFINGKTDDYGGAIAVYSGAENTYIENCSFINNTAACGSAISFNGFNRIYTETPIFRKAYLKNCIVSNNNATDVAGSVYSYNMNLTVDNCSIINNKRETSAYSFGGGISVHFGYLTVLNTVLKNNSAYYGGAIDIQGGETADIINCTFDKNNAVYYGGAIYIVTEKSSYMQYRCNLTVANSTFINNSAYYSGAIFEGEIISNITDGYTLFENCSFIENYASSYGGVLFIYPNSNSHIKDEFKNCTFIKNKAGSYGGAIATYNKNFDELLIYNCTFLNNYAGAYGGAIYFHKSSAKLNIDKSTFIFNFANGDYGHAIFMWDGELNMENSILESNGFVKYTSSDKYSHISIFLGFYGATISSLENNFWGNYTDVYPFDLDKDYGSLILIQKSSSSDEEVYVPNQWISMNITGPTSVTVSNPYEYNANWYTVTTISKDNATNNINSLGDSKNNVIVSDVPVSDGILPDYVGIINNNETNLVNLPNGSFIHRFNSKDDNYIGIYSPYTGNLLADINVTMCTKTYVSGTNVSGKPGSSVIITISLIDENGNGLNKSVNITFPDNSTKEVSVIDGKSNITWDIPKEYSKGDYTVTIKFNGDDEYINSTNTSVISVKPLDVSINAQDVVVNSGDSVTIPINIRDENNEDVSNGTVVVSLPDGSSQEVPVVNGKTNVTWNVPKDYDKGNYSVNLTYKGNNHYNDADNVSIIKITEAKIDLELVKGNYSLKAGDKGDIIYKLSNTGDGNAKNIISKFSIPKGLKLISVSPEYGTYEWNSKTRTLTWNLNQINPNEEYSIKFNVEGLSKGDYIIIPSIDCNCPSKIEGVAEVIVKGNDNPNPSPEPNPNPNPSPSNKHKSNSDISKNKHDSNNNVDSIGLSMKNTGIPILALLLCLLTIVGIKRKY